MSSLGAAGVGVVSARALVHPARALEFPARALEVKFKLESKDIDNAGLNINLGLAFLALAVAASGKRS